MQHGGGPLGDVAISKCLRSSVDVMFLMDSSSSVWVEDFKVMATLVDKVTSKFNLAPGAMRVGVVVYSDTPLSLVTMETGQTHKDIRDALKSAPHITGGTDTAMALTYARQHGFPYTATDRADVSRFIVLITDGQESNMPATVAAADQAHQEGIMVFAIGVGDNSRGEELQALASKPSDRFVLHVNNFTDLHNIDDLLAIKTCEIAAALRPPSKCPTTPMDLVFVYDTNSLTPAHHRYVISVISDVTEANGLVSSDLRVGVLREAAMTSEAGLHDIELTNQWDRWNFKQRLEAYDARRASISLLLRKARSKYFLSRDASGKKRVIVLFVDSVLDKMVASKIQAGRLQRSGVTVVVVSLGKHYDQAQLKALASNPEGKHVLHSPSVRNNYHKTVLVARLLQLLCG